MMVGTWGSAWTMRVYNHGVDPAGAAKVKRFDSGWRVSGTTHIEYQVRNRRILPQLAVHHRFELELGGVGDEFG